LCGGAGRQYVGKMRRHGLTFALLVACGGSSDDETSAPTATVPTASVGSIGSVGEAATTMGEATLATEGPPTSGTTQADTQGDTQGDTQVDPSDSLPKFDFGVEPDVMAMPPDTGCTKVDLLFVVDSSGSMADEQVTLVQSFPQFVATMQTELADTDSYHIVVVSTDAYPYNDFNCVQDGALVTQTNGLDSSAAVCTPFSTGKRWMDQSEPDLNAKFTCAGRVGTQGDGNERPMTAIQAALSPGLNAAGACNDGFIRDDALLVIVLITDEEDDHEVAACNMTPQPGSAGEPPDWYNGVVGAKAGVETNIVVLSLIGPTAQPCPALDKCNGGITGAEMSPRLVQFTEMFTYGSVGQICAPSYQQFFADAIGVIAGACENFMPPL
jgi:hypothetical protein